MNLGGRGDSGAINDECGFVDSAEGRLGADEEFSFVTVEFEEILLHPYFYGRQTGVSVGEGWVVEGFGAEVYLSVISIAVESRLKRRRF